MLDKQVKGLSEQQETNCSFKAFSDQRRSEVTCSASRGFTHTCPKQTPSPTVASTNQYDVKLLFTSCHPELSVLGNTHRTACSWWLPCMLARASLTSMQYHSIIKVSDNVLSIPFAFCPVIPASFLILNSSERFTCWLHPSMPCTHTWQTQLKRVMFPNFMAVTFLVLYHVILIVVSPYIIRSPEMVFPGDHFKLCSIRSPFFFF